MWQSKTCLNETGKKNIIDLFPPSSDTESHKMINVSDSYFLNVFNTCFSLVLSPFWSGVGQHRNKNVSFFFSVFNK